VPSFGCQDIHPDQYAAKGGDGLPIIAAAVFAKQATELVHSETAQACR